MFPILMSGDRIVVKRVSSLDLVVGDIVVYARADDALIAHRVMSIDQLPVASVVTKGDTATEADAPVSFERVIGKATAVLRDGGVLWIRAIDWRGHDLNSVASAIPAVAATAAAAAVQPARFNFSRSKVLDLRDMSAESIRNIGSVEDVSVVLLSPRTADAWSNVVTRGVKSILTVPDDYRVYTGQPELLPEMLDFMPGPIRLVVSGQLFLTQFDAEQIRRSIASLILSGQAYVSSGPAQTALAAVTTIIAGDIEIVPAEHARWIGESIVGPEYMASQPGVPLVVVGECATSPRMNTAAMPLVFTCAAAGEPLA
jgi:hypothetical protein